MADQKSTTFDGIMRDLKARRYAPVYCLMGDEPYYIDKIADYIASNVLREEERDFNQSIVFGSDVSGAQVSDLAKGYPMMADHRVVVVKEAQAIKDLEPIAKYLARPLMSTILVLCHKNGTIDRRKKVMAEMERVGVVFESKKLRDRDLPAFIEGYMQKNGAGIDRKSVMLIADSVGADLSRLVGEMDKLLLSLPEGKRQVDPELVARNIGVSKDFNGFELRDAIVNKNIYKANQIIKYFDSNPKAGSIYSFLPMLFNFFQNLMLAHYCPQKNNPDTLARHLDLRSAWATKDYTIGMKNYGAMKVMQIISQIRVADTKSKGINNPNTPPGELMKELIFFILH